MYTQAMDTMARAICTAPSPTDPLAPCTSTTSPDRGCARSSATCAVRQGTFTAAPSANDTRSGNGCTCPSVQITICRYAPYARLSAVPPV